MALTRLASLTVTAAMDASRYVAGMNAKVAADNAGAASSNAVGAAVARTDTKISAAGDGVTRLSRQFVEGFAAQERFNSALRILGRSLDTNAISAERADAVLTGLNRKYGLLASAENLAAAGQTRLAAIVSATNARLAEEAAAADRAAQALGRVATAQQRAGGAGNFNTANVAAQFQDIGVTAFAGQSPLQIALQQGTQLSAILGGQGLTGVVKTLGAAFASILSPVSLLTIGVVALAAAGIQWIAGMVREQPKAEDALRAHAEWLDKILHGYKAAGEAAKAAIEQAQQLPQGVVTSDLGKSLRDQRDEIAKLATDIGRYLDDLRSRIEEASSPAGPMMTGLNREDIAGLVQQIDLLKSLGIAADSTVPQLQAAMAASRDLFNTTDDPALANMANDAYTLAQQLLLVERQAFASRAALAAINNRALFDNAIAGAKELAKEVGAIVGLRPELRSVREQALDHLNAALGAQSTGALERAAALKEYRDTIAALDEQERRQKEAEAARTASTENERLASSYASIVAGVQRDIEAQRLQQQTMGLSEEAALRLTKQHELLARAQEAGIALTPTQRAELIGLADDLAAAELRTKALTQAQQENAAATEQLVGMLEGVLGDLFTKPIADAGEFFHTVLSGFAQLGSANLKSGLDTLFSGKLFAANDNGQGSFAEQLQAAVKAGSKEGTQAGAFGGLDSFFRSAGLKGGLAGAANIGLGGIGIGYQTQSPFMGALGGAISGLSAGPWGAVIGGIAGLIGGLLGMNEALAKARAALDEQRTAIDAFIATGFGDEISQYASALAQYQAKAAEYVKLAEAAGDSDLVRRLREASEAIKSVLAAQLSADITRHINELSGNGVYNQVADALDLLRQRLADIATLGGDAASANQELSLSLSSILSEADLTSQQLYELAAAFPELSSQILALGQQLQLDRQVSEARDALKEAYEREAATLRDVIEQNKRLVEGLEAFKRSLKLDSSLSALSPQDRLIAAQQEFERIRDLALGGDQTAMAQLEEVARAYLDQARQFYGSSEQYAAIFASVSAAVDQVIAVGQGQASAAQQQLDLMTEQTSTLVEINTSVLSVADAIARLTLLVAQQSGYGYAAGGIVGYAAGGMVGNGIWGQDSVLARYAGGGTIGLAGGEFISRAASVNSRTLGTLDYINRTGAVPGNDNSAVVDAIGRLADRMASLERTTAAGAVANVEATQENTASLGQVRRELGAQNVRRTG